MTPIATTRELFEAIRADEAIGLADRVRIGAPREADELPFVGRGRERAELAELLEADRWITLVGAGGVGKTRLARAVAEDLSVTGDSTVVFVPLEAVHGSDFVVAAIADAARLPFEGSEPPWTQLARALHDRDVVLAVERGDLAMARRRVDAAVRIARAAQEDAAALHALIVRARLVLLEGDDRRAGRCLAAVITHGASEARDVEAARQLLGDAEYPDPVPTFGEVA